MSVEGVGGSSLAVPTSDEKTMAMIAHGGGVVAGFIPALIIYLTKGTESAWVKQESLEALNFQITVAIAFVACIFLTIITLGFGALLFPLLWIGSTIFSIMGAIAANNSQAYKYPFALRLIK
jgi:uncharacterized Tic20 family protein